MNRLKLQAVVVALFAILATGCKGGYDGQLVGVTDRAKWDNNLLPYGMVYIPSGTLHIGPSDQDITYAFNARSKAISIVGFYMDDTEISNNEYRQFVFWVRDSIAHKTIGGDHLRETESGEQVINWDMPIDWSPGGEDMQALQGMHVTPENQLYVGMQELDVEKMEYEIRWFKWKEAAQRDNAGKPRSEFIEKRSVKIYPDTMVWIRDFTYSYNEPMTRTYFSHPAYDEYPVVGVSWMQANAFSHWRTRIWNDFRLSEGKAGVDEFRLPTEHEWEYAARGGRVHSPYPWGGPYLRNTKGCLLANFKPGRGNYPEDGGFYTVNVRAYWPNDFGLYNMAGNVSEWTLTAFYENAYNFIHDKNPDIRYDAKDDDHSSLKRKVIRGGSWKDIGYFLQTGTRSFEYQDSTKSYVGFRNVLPFLGRAMNDFKP
jgi:formylglycine-generating enzyme